MHVGDQWNSAHWQTASVLLPCLVLSPPRQNEWKHVTSVSHVHSMQQRNGPQLDAAHGQTQHAGCTVECYSLPRRGKGGPNAVRGGCAGTTPTSPTPRSDRRRGAPNRSLGALLVLSRPLRHPTALQDRESADTTTLQLHRPDPLPYLPLSAGLSR